jgi:Mg-chelatase subunit ChlD
MPAPSFLRGLPKPILFGLYGAVGGLLGALLFAEPVWQILRPPPPPPAAPPEPQVAVATSPELEVFTGGRNTFPVLVERAGFDGPVTVRFENLPAKVSVDSVTLPAGKNEATATVTAAPGAGARTSPIRAVAEAEAGGKKITAETSIPNFRVADPARPQADVVFVLDVTGSMQWAIDGVRNGIGRFAGDLARNQIDYRIGLVAFRDLTYPEDERKGLKLMEVLKFKGEPFTSDADAFRSEVAKLRADGGGDTPESSLEAVGEACRLPLRKGATRVLLLITDAPPKVGQGQTAAPRPGEVAAAVRDAAEVVRRSDIDALHIVVQPPDRQIYEPLMEAGQMKGGGEYFNLQEVAAGGAGFNRLLDKFSAKVTEAAKAKNPDKPQTAAQAEKPVLGVQGVQSSAQFAKGSEGQLTLAIGLWTGAIAGLVCLALLAGQYHYLRGSWPAAGGVIAGLVGGLVVGTIGGVAGQALFMLAPENAFLAGLFRVFGWALLGGLAGVGLSLFIPNLRWVHGLTGGAIGGAIGAIGFLAVSSAATDLVGRLVGGLILGFSIGLMVAIVEAAFRRAWLEVRYGSRETITVNLGPEPVKVGGDSRACTVWARGAAPLALRYFIRGGQVICEDAPTRHQEAVGNGDTREVGNVTVTVHTGSGSGPVAPPVRTHGASARPVAPPPVRPPAPAPEPLELEPIEPEPLPRPAPAAPVPPTPAIPAPRPPVPAGGAGPRPSAPPRPVAPPPSPKPAAGPRDPDACPGCGRKNPGRPGSRYCMVCDQTY